MFRLWRHVFDRLAGPPVLPPEPPPPPPVTVLPPEPPPLPPVPVLRPRVEATGSWPRTWGPDALDSRPRVFDPALRQFQNAFRPGDPTFADAETAGRWVGLRRQATDHVLRAIAESAWSDGLILRGSRLLRAWCGAAAREPGDLDWVVDPPTARPDDRAAVQMFDGLVAAVLGRAGPPGLAFDPARVAVDDIWTYERAPGRRVAFPWQAAGLPGGSVQVDVVFGEELAVAAGPMSIPAADGGCVSVRAAGPAQSLAWKLLWLMADMHPQGKDLYDAVILAERFPLPLDVLADALRRGGVDGVPVTAVGLTLGWQRVDWENFRTEYRGVDGGADEWLIRLETALGPTFTGSDGAGAEVAAAEPAGAARSWLTPTVVALARGIDAEGAFDRLPILADALQDAGCEDEDVLAHCRAHGPHTRGCAVVDQLLGRE